MIGTVTISKTTIATTTGMTIASVADNRLSPSRSILLTSGLSRYARTMPATNGNRTPRNKMRTATNATSIAIQKTIGRAKLMFDSYRRRRSVSCVHLREADPPTSALCQKRTRTRYSITTSMAASSDGGMVKPTAPRLFGRAADTPPFQVLSRGSLMILASVLALVYQWYVIRGVVLFRCGWHRQKIGWALVDGKLDTQILPCERFAHGRRWRAAALRLHRRVH